ncbi:hypothetical protein [Nonomuraea sp. NPDC050691]|uniref:hypothetical protein n=1 Tax=Nonomuraea sp. NPDC050691 TaxID=3155661 RepID=UPI0033FAC260
MARHAGCTTDPDAGAPALRTVVERLLAAGKHQERLIEALLTLARSRQGPERRRPLDLAEITRHALDERGGAGDPRPGAEAEPGATGHRPGVEADPDATGHRPRVEADLRPAPAAGDRALVERLVANLVATPPGTTSRTAGSG